ncbi:hypothetical protein BKA70DRAFT_1235908 [Coprinopsis sp. MPI-PUGE-AT-0042]|nr:hypothetical protein BKA70DRAFT_1235908 [Coprinopsis sp. MPI-PUGE-AT-0042]
MSLSAQTQQTRLIETTLLATPSATLHPSPQAILATMRGSHGEIEARASLFKLDEDMQVVIKADGGHGVDENSEELGSEDEDGSYATHKDAAEGELHSAIGVLGYKRLLPEWLSRYANSASSAGRSAANDAEFFVLPRTDGVPRTRREWDIRRFTVLAMNYQSAYFAHFTSKRRQYQHMKHSGEEA